MDSRALARVVLRVVVLVGLLPLQAAWAEVPHLNTDERELSVCVG